MAHLGRPPRARDGKIIANHPDGFPCFFAKRRPRVITANPWAFMEHTVVRQLPRAREPVALAYIAQARDFYEAAQTPRLGSKPLLYYYAFLNLSKAALVTRNVALPAAAKHGISDPRANARTRLRLEGQRIEMPDVAGNHSLIFPEFVKLLGGDASARRTFRVIDLLGQVPVIHRTYTQVSGASPTFLPLKAINVLKSDTSVWARLTLDRNDRDVKQVLPVIRSRRAFQETFKQVGSESEKELWFETQPEVGHARAIDPAIAKVAERVRTIGTASILTRYGYRHYLSCVEPRLRLPDLAVAYAVAFYFGSVVRYKPDAFKKIVGGGYSWLVQEFFASAPSQFLYGLASFLAGVDVIRPFGSLE
jgi:hypothetical protein